jgi:multiple sugar transport system permease protein
MFRGKELVLSVFRAAAISAALFIAIFPLFWVVTSAFKTPAAVNRLPPIIFFKPTVENFITVWQERFFLYFENSVVITGGSVAITIVIGVLAAFGLSRLKIKFKRSIMIFILSVRFSPYIVFALPLFLIMSRVKLIGYRPAIVFVYIIINLPIVIWLMRSFFDDIPLELDEAAALDGASQFLAFRKIILPCAAPGIATVTLLSFIFAWNEYLFALILSGRDSQTLTVGLTQFLGGMESAVRWGVLSAWSAAVIAPVVLVALLVNKQLRKGFSGSVGG